MSNYTAFDPAQLKALLEPFASGMSEHITPIKYEAITPDLFLLLFRTTGKDGADHYFISIEFDFIADLKEVKELVHDWHGEVLSFWSPLGRDFTAQSSLKDLSARITKPYYALLAEVERPTDDSYWATNIVIMPGDRIKDKLSHLTEKQQQSAYAGIANSKSRQQFGPDLARN